MMSTLVHDPTKSRQANTFQVRPCGGCPGVFSVEMHVRASDVAVIYHATVYLQIGGAHGDHRLHDPSGRPALLMRRLDEAAFEVEAFRLHKALPKCPVVLRGWCPEGDG